MSTKTPTPHQDRPADRYAHIVNAALSQTTGLLDFWSAAYVTDGGTWMLASSPEATDSGRPRDLIAVLPATLDLGTRVVPLRPTVNPNLVDALRTALDHRGGPQ